MATGPNGTSPCSGCPGRRDRRPPHPRLDTPRTRQDGGSPMKSTSVTMALACALAASTTFAQAPAAGRTGATRPPAAARSTAPPDLGLPYSNDGHRAPAPTDVKVFPSGSALPAPIPPDQIKPAAIALPQDPIEPYLLTRDAGPFMVAAKTFRGPDADRYALALALELRRDYGLPAYILRSKD